MSETIMYFTNKEMILKNPQQLKTNMIRTTIRILSSNQIVKIDILPVNIRILSCNQAGTLYGTKYPSLEFSHSSCYSAYYSNTIQE